MSSIISLEKSIKRNFTIGDSWLYYKIYTGPKTSDTILTSVLKPAIRTLFENKIIEKWFFIRYADPKQHLRIRFNYQNREYIGKIINILNDYFNEFIEDDLIWKIQIDTYQREIERYGSKTIHLSEDLFFHDSEMIIDFIDIIDDSVEGEELRWLFSIRAIDSFLNSFNLTDADKKNLLINLSDNFRKEFDVSKHLGKQLSNKFRIERSKIEQFMTFSSDDFSEYKPILDLLEKKNKNIANIAAALLDYRTKNILEIELSQLLGSYIHMLMNRLFKSKNRLHEMVCYDFLCRFYISKIARGLQK